MMKQSRQAGTMILAGAALLLLLLGVADGFQSRRAFVSPHFVSPSQNQVLQATIYNPSWEEENTGSSTSDLLEDTSSIYESSFPIPESLRDQSWTAPLSRLAAGYCNPGGLKIEHIAQVSVISASASRLDIEAVVCEEDSCVSLSVPVYLPKPCDADSEFEACILENIKTLDYTQLEAAARNQFATEAENRMATALHSTTVEFPEWWVHPFHIDLAKQCDSLVAILNEADFQNDLIHLVNTKLSDTLVGRAAVVAVGPAGLILRAIITPREEDGEQLIEMVEVPIAFAVTAADIESLRDAVLDCVEQFV